MEGPLGVGMPRTEGDTQEVDFFSPQALLESYRAMSEDSVHSAQEAAHRPCSINVAKRGGHLHIGRCDTKHAACRDRW